MAYKWYGDNGIIYLTCISVQQRGYGDITTQSASDSECITNNMEYYLSSMETIFRATVSEEVNAHVLGCALDFFSFQCFKIRVRILFALFSIPRSWEENPKGVVILRFSWSVNFGDGFTTTSLKLSIDFWE